MIVNKLNLFPTTVVVIDDFLSDTERERLHSVVDPLTSIPRPSPSLLLRDDRLDTQTQDLEWFYKKSTDAVLEHFHLDMEVYQSIYNSMDINQNLLFHHHLNLVDWDKSLLRSLCLITGCYYVNSGEGFAKLRFNNPQLLTRLIGEAPAYNHEAKPNQMVLFPSWALHGTTTHGSTQTRHVMVLEMTLN